MTNPTRQKLTLKKPKTALEVAVKPAPIIAAKPKPMAKPVPAKKPVNPPKKKPKAQPNPDKEKIRLENIRINAEEVVRRKVQIEKAKPLMDAYFEKNPVFRESVLIDGVECLRPLMIGTRKSLFTLFKSNPELQDCTNTVLTDLISDALESHVAKPQYVAGLVKFNERFDLEGNPVEAIAEKHKAGAIERARAG